MWQQREITTTFRVSTVALSMAIAFAAPMAIDGSGRHAHAEVSVGARLGGYGFRDAASARDGQTQWRACRMNGIGVFGEYAFSDTLYAEVGLDAYFVDSWLATDDADANEWAIDRTSMLISGAVGARAWSGKRISPNVHVGLGGEFTKVTLGDIVTSSERYTKPVAFIGFGGDLNLGKVLLGMSLRIHSMTLFAPDRRNGGVSDEADFAAQMQFWAKYRL
ncbi:MAG: hypothetical protein IPL79_13305 [Myxococcales bacterium]|nr:hypothetical protein [Myxococcales bacterium]